MSSEFQKKASGMLVSVLIGLIVISFMFSGYQSMRFSSSALGKVGSYEIKINEYQNELNRTIKYYSQMLGGKNLTAKDIERFGLKRQVIRKIINMKLRFILADRFHIYPAKEQIADQIQQLPYFLDNGVFSITKYKQLLKANGLTPQAFEKTVVEDLKTKELQESFSKVPLSKEYLQDLENFKSTTLSGTMFEFSPTSIQNNFPITKAEIDNFLQNPENRSKVEKLFHERQKSLSTPEQVHAYHILLKTQGKDEKAVKKAIYKLARKVTPKNFIAMAKKYTEDPSGKTNGGDLGTFKRGRMVKSFEAIAFSTPAGHISKPIKTQFGYHIIYVKKHIKAVTATLKRFKHQLATEIIRKGKAKAAAKKTKELIATFKKLLTNNQLTAAKKLAKKYGVKLEENQKFNFLDGYQGTIQLPPSLLMSIYKANLQQNKFFLDEGKKKISIAYISKFEHKKLGEKERKYITTGQEFLLTKTLVTDMMSAIEKKVNVHIRKGVLD